MIEIMGMPVGPLQSNCYLILCTKTQQCVIVDPGEEPDAIVNMVNMNKAEPVLIINTHGHGDHIGANRAIKERYDIPLAIHEDDARMLTDPQFNMSALLGFNITSPPADILLKDGDRQEFADTSIEILHTPGHSPGGISLLIENHLLSGDALFNSSIGRSDIPGASHEQLIRGIKEKLMALPDDTIVYPGHGPTTTIGEERQNNPFLL